MSHHVAGALGSKWGNPFKVQGTGKNARKNCLKRYEDHIRNDPKLFREIMELEGKELGCWCKPSPCHGDILIKLFKERQSKNLLKSDYQASSPILTQCGSNGDDGDDCYDCYNTDCAFNNVFINSGDVMEGTPSMSAPLRLNGGGDSSFDTSHECPINDSQSVSNENDLLSWVNQNDSMSEQDIRDILFDAGYANEDIQDILTSKSKSNESACETLLDQSVISESESVTDSAYDVLREIRVKNVNKVVI